MSTPADSGDHRSLFGTSNSSRGYSPKAENDEEPDIPPSGRGAAASPDVADNDEEA